MSELPKGWRWATPDELASSRPNALTIGPFGSDLKVSDYRASGVPLVFVREIRANRFGDERTKFLDESKAAQLSRHLARPGDLLITKMGDPPGDAAVYPTDRPPAVITADCIKMTVDETIADAQFLRAAFGAEVVLPQIAERSVGVAQQKLSLERFRTLKLPLPPLDEQRRIVAKLEALQARSRRSREALDAIPPLLEKLRQSILAAAFRGDLTKAWRAQNPDVEPASELLKRIRVERRAKWEEAELAKMIAKGKAPKDDRWKAKYEEPKPVDASGLPELPEGWCWASVDELAWAAEYGTSAKSSDEGDVPVLAMGNIVDGHLQFARLKHLPNSHDEFPALLLEPGDILFNRTNSPELVGKSAMFEGISAGQPSPCSFASYLIRLRTAVYDPYLLTAYINSPAGRAWVSTQVTQQTGQANVSGTKLKALAIPVPPFEEQALIVAALRVSRNRMAGFAESAGALRANHTRLDRGVLGFAFRGELVPQDSSEAPARPAAEATPAPSAKRKNASSPTNGGRPRPSQ